MSFDLKIFYFFNNLAGKSDVFDFTAIFFADYLEYALAAIFILFLYLENRSHWQKFQIFLITAISMAIARFGVTNLIRFLYPRPRPFETYNINILITNNGSSFPSGHAALFFAMAMAIYFYNKKWGAWFFAVALVMGIARVIAGVHYPTDILGGAIIGVSVSYLVFLTAEKNSPKL